MQDDNNNMPADTTMPADDTASTAPVADDATTPAMDAPAMDTPAMDTPATDAPVMDSPVADTAMPADDATTTPAADVDMPAMTDDTPADVEPAEETPAAPAPSEMAAAPTGPVTATPTGTDAQGRQLYMVKCSNCGKDTEVPFQPAPDRPVYCRDCFMEMRNKQS